jgi:hypothetical protein
MGVFLPDKTWEYSSSQTKHGSIPPPRQNMGEFLLPDKTSFCFSFYFLFCLGGGILPCFVWEEEYSHVLSGRRNTPMFCLGGGILPYSSPTPIIGALSPVEFKTSKWYLRRIDTDTDTIELLF